MTKKQTVTIPYQAIIDGLNLGIERDNLIHIVYTTNLKGVAIEQEHNLTIWRTTSRHGLHNNYLMGTPLYCLVRFPSFGYWMLWSHREMNWQKIEHLSICTEEGIIKLRFQKKNDPLSHCLLSLSDDPQYP